MIKIKQDLSNSLAIKYPELILEWHPTKNGDLSVFDVTYGSNKKVWWQCSKNPKHEWAAQIKTRSINQYGCPYCSGYYPTEENNLLVANPDLCKEWNYDKNNKTPEKYSPFSHEEVWWKCSKNSKHEWQVSIANRNKGRKCPYCSRKLPSENYNLVVCNPELASEWNYKRNIKQPQDYCPKSQIKVWWKCKECGHEWEAIIGSRTGVIKRGCPSCSKSKGEKRIRLWLEQNNIIFEEEYDKFKDLIGVGEGLLRFDFCVFLNSDKSNIKLLIEFDGQQHFQRITPWQTIKDFNALQYHDKLKNEYCEKHNVKLLRIKYNQFDNIENILSNEFLNN